MRFQKKLSINKNTNAKYMVSYYSVYSYKKELFEKTDFFPTTHLEFEGKDYQVMKNYDKFLTQLYGNYMELPPVEKRINHKPLKIDFGDEK